MEEAVFVGLALGVTPAGLAMLTAGDVEPWSAEAETLNTVVPVLVGACAIAHASALSLERRTVASWSSLDRRRRIEPSRFDV